MTISLAEAAVALYTQAPSVTTVVVRRVAHQSRDQLLQKTLAAWWVKVLIVFNTLVAIPLHVYVSAIRTVPQAWGLPQSCNC